MNPGQLVGRRDVTISRAGPVACWCAACAPLHFGSWSTTARWPWIPAPPVHGPARGQRSTFKWKDAPAMGNMYLAAAAKSGSGNYTFLIVIVVLFGLLYFVMIRPQRNKQRQAQAMQSQVQPGQRVRTTAGMYATVVEADDHRRGAGGGARRAAPLPAPGRHGRAARRGRDRGHRPGEPGARRAGRRG